MILSINGKFFNIKVTVCDPHNLLCHILLYKQGRKRPLDTPKRMIERREIEGERERER